MKAYEKFLRSKILWVLIAPTVFYVASVLHTDTPEEQQLSAWKSEWSDQCEQLVIGESFTITQREIGSQNFCMKTTQMEDYPLYLVNSWELGCNKLGGVKRSVNSVWTCLREEVVEELGAQEDFRGSQ